MHEAESKEPEMVCIYAPTPYGYVPVTYWLAYRAVSAGPTETCDSLLLWFALLLLRFAGTDA